MKIAKESGNIKAVNMALVGLMAASTEIAKEVWLDAIREVIPSKLLDVNLRAFEAGKGQG